MQAHRLSYDVPVLKVTPSCRVRKLARIKKEPNTKGKLKTKYLPGELEKMFARAQGRSLADSEAADELVPEFDLVKNFPLTPWHVTAGSSILVYWTAHCGDGKPHVFKNTVAARVAAIKRESPTRGCRLCSRYKHIPSMPLRKHYPEIAKQWMERENEFPTRFLDCRSQRAGLFRCQKNHDHVFRSKLRNLTVDDAPQNCPICYQGERVNLKRYPRLFPFYDRTKKNRGFDPRHLPKSYKVFWRCPNGHRRYASFFQVIALPCKKCQPPDQDSLTLADFPTLKAQYWPSLNGGRSAESIPIKGNSALVINWSCTESDEEHPFAARLSHRLRGSGCPICARKKCTEANSLAQEKYKDVASEIDRAEHPDIRLSEISPGSAKKLAFVCRRCGKKWKARIDRRCLGGQGCSSCKAKSRMVSASKI